MQRLRVCEVDLMGMENYWEQQRREAESRRTRMEISGLKNENELLRRKITTLENNSYDDHDLWNEINQIKRELAKLKQKQEATH